MSLPDFVFANLQETVIRNWAASNATEVNKVLLGTYLEVLEEDAGFYKVVTRRAGPGGWVAKGDVTEKVPLKVFFVDVGQGDGTLIECPQGVVVIDGGQGDGFHHFLRHRYKPIFDAGEQVHIAAMVISHPDADHYKGLEDILEDEDFTVGTIYHNGLMRYASSVERSRSNMIDKGYLVKRQLNGDDAYFITDLVDDLPGILARVDDMPSWFKKFWQAAESAEQAGRLTGGAKRIKAEDDIADFDSPASDQLQLFVLGPRLHTIDGADAFLAFEEPHHRDGPPPDYPDYGYSHSHTRNGHSIILRLEFGDHRMLLGGDLNIPAEQHLIEQWGEGTGRFEAHVAKACHHGSADFSPEFLKLVRPYATVISSGDNKSFDHPTAGAVGATARYSRGTIPLLFSTELARAYQIDSPTGVVEDIHYGLINLRSNRTLLTMAQMKEQRTGKTDIWDSYTIPWEGKFWYERD